MLYLNFLKLIFKSETTKSLVLILGFLLSLNTVLFSNTIKNKIVYNSGEQENSRYFNALIETNIDYSKITRKMKNLPGIKKVIFTDSRKIKNKIESLTQNLDVSLPESIKGVSFYSLKVIVDNSIESSKINLIQDYLGQIFGESKITIGDVKKNKVSKVLHSKLYLHFDWAIFSLMMTVLILVFLTQSAGIFKQAYLIEKFQRKSNIFEVSFFSFFFFLTLSNLAVCFYKQLVPAKELMQGGVFSLFFLMAVISAYQIRKRSL